MGRQLELENIAIVALINNCINLLDPKMLKFCPTVSLHCRRWIHLEIKFDRLQELNSLQSKLKSNEFKQSLQFKHEL